MTVIRRRWMQEMAVREIALLDGQLLGHAINSASFFASSNLILIAAAAGVLFGGDNAWKSIEGLAVLAPASQMMFEFKLGLVLVALARGLLDFIWSIRQMNYCLAAIGATPMWAPPAGARPNMPRPPAAFSTRRCRPSTPACAATISPWRARCGCWARGPS
jgi:uncharacterized membrane protein